MNTSVANPFFPGILSPVYELSSSSLSLGTSSSSSSGEGTRAAVRVCANPLCEGPARVAFPPETTRPPFPLRVVAVVSPYILEACFLEGEGTDVRRRDIRDLCYGELLGAR